MKGDRINNEERRLWIENDEGLYNWYRSERIPMQKFIKEHREEIDQVIRAVMGGTKPQHYLAYPENRKGT